jgi:predicted DNA-binding transcriptional regulator AlpA
MFDRRTLSEFLRVSIRTLDRLDADGKLPRAVRVGAAKRWTREAVEEWVRLGCPSRDEPASTSERAATDHDAGDLEVAGR